MDELPSEGLEYEWSMLPDVEHWCQEDLQLAAELGNTLLERNKELEKCLRQQQNTIDDQAQEIEYLNKQTVALREVNDSRLRVYEQLEVGIQELELQNHRFAIESTADKKQVKTLLATIEQLEERYDDLQKSFEEVQRQLTLSRRQQNQRKNSTTQNNNDNDMDSGKTRPRKNSGKIQENGLCNNQDSLQPTLQEKTTKCNSTKSFDNDTNVDTIDGRLGTDPSINNLTNNVTNCSSEYNDEIIQLLKELADERAQRTRDQRRVSELEEQMTSLLRQIQTLEQQLHEYQQKEVMTSMHEEISTLEEVRDGHLCGRCLRHVDEHARDELSAMLNQEHSIIYEDESSVQSNNNSVISDNVPYKTTLSLEIQAGAPESEPNPPSSKIPTYERANPYRDLVEKYEALLSVEASVPRSKRSHRSKAPPTKSLSLQEELQMSGDYNSLSSATKDTDDESGHGTKVYRTKKFTNSRTPTDFSEAETSSSGFADETSNKATQTDKSGPYVCTIGDGTDKFCIYNDTIDTSFQNHPKYRELFKEIFQVLKTGTDNKEVEEPQHQPIEEVQSDFTDDQSVTSFTNSEMSTTLVEPVTPPRPKTPPKTTPKMKKSKSKQEVTSPAPQPDPPTPKHKSEAQIILTPYKREPLELSLGLQLRKKSSSRKNSLKKADRCESPVLPLSPKVLYSSRLANSPNGRANQKRRDFKPVETPVRALTDSSPIWNGDSLQFWSSKQVPTTNGTPSQFLPSTASQDLSKLKKLEVTYAEALRNADKKKLSRMSSGGQTNRRK